MGHFLKLTLACSTLLAATTGQAAIIGELDQENTPGGLLTSGGVANGLGLAQTFTPTKGGIDVVEFLLGSTVTTSVRVDLYQGSGFSGGGVTHLGNTDTVNVTSVSGNLMRHFHFATTHNLTPGSLYTLHIVNRGGDNYFALYGVAAGGTHYTGGTAFQTTGAVAADADLVFREGLHTAAVPEPASLVLWSALGLMGLAGSRRRKREAAPADS